MKDLKFGIPNNDRLFTNWLGGESNTFIPSTVSAKFKDFLKRIELPIVKLHSLRHANITTMIAMRSRS